MYAYVKYISSEYHIAFGFISNFAGNVITSPTPPSPATLVPPQSLVMALRQTILTLVHKANIYTNCGEAYRRRTGICTNTITLYKNS